MKIKELRGVSRLHLASHGDNHDIYLEVCHAAEVKDKKAFCINGQRYVVVNTETGDEVYLHFPKDVEKFLEDK